MDAIDILGSILGHKTSRPGRGADAVNDINKRRAGRSQSSSPRPTGPTGPIDITREAEDLEDMLDVAHQRQHNRQIMPAPHTTPAPAPQPVPAPQRMPRDDGGYQSNRRGGGLGGDPSFGDPGRGGSASPWPPQREGLGQDEQAQVLVRAMVSAAKADGQIDRSEQQSILERLGDSSPQATQFLRDEFNKPLDVRELAWSVPIGMEQQVYMASLIAIDLDTVREASYLNELAHGLRIPQDVREQIHQRLGAPSLF